ncbi:c-type cytochrome biogenesis protein CcmI [Pseudolabrys sp. FHR47]|uniref:c-type cytochrome biogenesis protein CcmI n=1 Tax=Pseudolabrys sp. FHR47 TaxID=2562284 RepID=UPI0010BEFDA1|nr:c-type cytochrome biogenesis protein CcmI [Pseudolabrys sp. FHR47]
MSLWFVFALMTAAAIFAVLWPLGRSTQARGGSDLAVYRDQLEEIARDRAEGRIGEAEADAARTEVSRRLIAAADAAEKEAPASGATPVWRRRAAALIGLVLLPIGASALYLTLGSPQVPGQPLAERRAAAQQDTSIETLIARVEAHLEKNPNDARGYEVIAPVYLRMGRFADAVNARRKAIALAGESAQRQADLGEALAALGNGVITADAKAAFERALELDRNDLKALYFIGLAAEQDGDRKKAAAIWLSMLKDAPPGAPWLPMVSEALTRVGGVPPKVADAKQPGPTVEDIAAATQMSEQDRGEMVRGMVARLADRLKEDGSDVAGWQRLLRAYMVLGDRDKAKGAAGDARKALAADPDKLRQIDEAIKSMGLEG